MNRKMVAYISGQILKCEALLLVLPGIVALLYREVTAIDFFITALIALILGLALTLKKPENRVIYAREGFLIVALAWVLMSLVGALPFFFSKQIPNYIDAVFEIVSGFTTTGSSILPNVELLDRGMLFWRSFSHWVGGMGVLVFVMAVVPLADDRSMHLMRAEVPGPTVGKLVPKLKETAKILYGIYIVMTLILIVLLVCGGMNLFDAAVHAFGTAGTGGFGVFMNSVAHYNSVYIDVVITVFMALFGINFNLFFFLLIGNFKSVFKNEELRVYLGIMLTAMVVIALDIMPQYGSFWTSLRYSSFQVSSIMTTTGFSTADFNLWPELSRTILVFLMFCGAMAGSTGGGIKSSRLLLMVRMAKNELKRMLHPRSVRTVMLDGKTVGSETMTGVVVYMILYIIIACVSVLLLAIDRFDSETNFTAMAACLNNIGPGLGVVGPLGSFAGYSWFSKIVLSFDMLFGRLELFPMLLLFAPSAWRKRG